MSKPSILTIRVPSELKHRIKMAADDQGVSINQLAMYIFTKEIGNLEAGRTLAKSNKGYSEKKIMSDFDQVMAKVRENPVPDWDNMDEE